MTDYALTVKNNMKDFMAYKEDFNALLIDLFPAPRFNIGPINYELDSMHKLHIHTTIHARGDKLKYTDYMRKGWHIYIRRIDKKLGDWLHYTTKEPRSYDQLLQQRLIDICSKENMFIDNNVIEWDKY